MTLSMIRQILLIFVFVSLVRSDPDSAKSTVTREIGVLETELDMVNDQMNREVPTADTLSPEAKENLYATEIAMENGMAAEDQTVTYPMGLKEGEAAELTQLETGISELNQKMASVEGLPENALTEAVERAIINADEKLKYIVKDLETSGQEVVPSIPSEVTVSLAELAASSKAFNIPPRLPEPPAQTTTAIQANRLLAQTPSLPPIKKTSYVSMGSKERPGTPMADQTAAGDDMALPANGNGNGSTLPVQSHGDANTMKSKEINKALNRLDKKLKKTEKRKHEVPLFHGKPATQSDEFKQLEERMKSLESTMKQIPSLAATKKEQDRVVKVRNDVGKQLEVTAEEAKASAKMVGVSHADITAEKVRLMTDLVKNLDDLGRFFGEEEIVDEDDFLSLKEDPKIALAEGNLASAAGRLRGNMASNPNRFADEYRLEDIEQYLSHPVALSHLAPEDPAKNLAYLRNLRNYVVSMKEKETRA